MTPDEKKPGSSNARAVTRFVLGYLGRDAMRVSGFVAGMFAHVVLTVASTRLIGLAVEHAGSGTGLGRLGLDLAAILGVLLAAICARWVSDRAINRHTAEAMAAIVASGFTKVQAFETSWHADNFAGATARKITRAAQGYDMVVSCCYFFFLPSILLVLVTAAVIAPESALAAGAMLVGSVSYFIVITWYNRTRVMPLMTAAFAHDSRITGELVDALGNNAAVKAWATERQEEARLRHIVGQWSAKLIAAWNGAVNSDQLQTGISAVILVAPIAIIVLQARWGLVDAGTVATVIGSGFVLRGWLGNIGRGVREAQNAVSEMTELVSLLGRICEAEQDSGLRSLTIGRGGIRFEAIGFRYAEAGAAVFEDLTLDIAPGQTVALVGPSGGGKSSFVKLLLGLYRPQQGRILIDGQDVAHCTRASIRRAIALVPQDPALFHRTIADNLAYGAETSTRAQIHEAARRARLDTLIHSLPKGYETLVGERGIKLSGGERQRVAIARALAASRPVLVFDEATSSLDTANEHAIQQALHQAMSGRTTIIVAHRLSTIRHADRILVFDRGQIVEDGTHAELAKRPGGVYARLLSVDEAQAA
jgi:ATP-binding cassette subfamily B protein